MPDMQLDIFGNEVEHSSVCKNRNPMGAVQFAVLDEAREKSVLTTEEAARFLHERKDCTHCTKDKLCDFAFKDAIKVLRGLKDRGHLKEFLQGRWSVSQ